jgi:hypothetical protein
VREAPRGLARPERAQVLPERLAPIVAAGSHGGDDAQERRGAPSDALRHQRLFE